MNEMSWNFIHKLVTNEPLEMNHVHFLVTPRIEKFRDFSAYVVYTRCVNPIGTYCKKFRKEIGTTEKLSTSGLCGSVIGRKSINSKERPDLDSRRRMSWYFSLLSLIVYITQAPTEAVFQNLLSVLKIFSTHKL